MSTPDQDNDQPTSPLLARLKGDSLILIAAVAFLGVALLFAALFGNAPDTNRLPATAIARATLETSAPSDTEPTTTPASATAIGAGIPTSLAEVPTSQFPTSAVNEPYPIPATATLPPAVVPTLQAIPSPPVFAPTLLPATIVLPTPILEASTVVSTPQVPPTVRVATPIPTTAPPPPTAVSAPGQPEPTVARTAADADQSTPVPTRVPVTVLRGTTYWRAAQSPIILSQNLTVAAGSALIIEPGVEVRLGPGVALSTDGKLYALGRSGQPVRFVGASVQRWEGIYGRPGSEIILEQTEIRGGGAGGTVLASEGGTLALRGTRINDNGGHIQSQNSRLEVRDSEIAGNDMPYGAALEARFQGGTVTLVNTRIGGNRMASGAPQVLLQNDSQFDPMIVEVRNNLLVGQAGPNLTLATGITQIGGEVSCNALLNGTNGLSIRSETPQVPGFPLRIVNNAIDDHVPPILPIYLKYGIGRGATSEVEIDMRNNWWGTDLGPYEPDRYADGRGDSVGENIAFMPWLNEWPACAPRP